MAISTAETGAKNAGRRILVIDDNADHREMMRILFENAGHEVHDAADGVSGVDLAVRVQPDVVLVDIGLPGIDGYEVARRIRAMAPTRAVLIAVSGYGRPEDRRRSLEAGFDEHLLKPVDPEHLTSVVADFRGRRC